MKTIHLSFTKTYEDITPYLEEFAATLEEGLLTATLKSEKACLFISEDKEAVLEDIAEGFARLFPARLEYDGNPREAAARSRAALAGSTQDVIVSERSLVLEGRHVYAFAFMKEDTELVITAL